VEAVVTTPAELRAALVEHRLLAILRGPSPDHLVEALRTLADAGVRLAEVSLTSTDALAVLREGVATVGDRMLIGAGTVLTGVQAEDSLAAGARFLVTPAAGGGADAAYSSGTAVLTGALTPTEVWAAHDRGAAAVKVFPASLGGPGYLRALLGPFPEVPLVPVGGVDAEAATAHLAAGAVAVGVGSPLLGDAADGGDLAALTARAKRFQVAVA
jgi:2-dehydro-3-deoxyphosphogluconate aldolase / (4S)-4-hydroxy-2-oxoglutarate aldolase